MVGQGSLLLENIHMNHHRCFLENMGEGERTQLLGKDKVESPLVHTLFSLSKELSKRHNGRRYTLLHTY